ncbi:complex I NDUFA9 subunit family protein [Halomonas campisalis]|uniref:Complex I NDUFA9 subunit family protein n=1 Tax=Billgrantia campisalis TaxID=74661 RepID=A0ABS9PBV1_9GAMM|nr:complex I NDUFA9 subunit family protein [Halomonas campisalis]MCG6659244.1 complex I NDUFA9 subunit family protein [Halomonas campisalis]MDR5864243.1 complex I NDUFA9 subunit family protein [Halomonas campisalis]
MPSGPITVFGGTGFLGSAIVHELVDAGQAVRIAARRPVLPAWAQEGDPLSLIHADIRDEASVADALDGAGGVVNAVSLYVQSREARFDAIHVEGAGRLARLARDAGVEELVHVSGIGSDSRSPSSYVRARAQGEAEVIAGFPKAVIVRPSVLFGPGDAFLGTLAGLARLPVIPLFGRGETRLQPVHVVDVARAVVRLLGGNPPRWRLFELGGPEVIRYRDILALLLAYLERERPLLPIPFPLWHLLALLASVLPNPPLTRDQVFLMQQDNCVSEAVGSFAELGIAPRALRDSLPECLPAAS